MYEFKRPDKRRPVLVLSRPDVIPLLRTVMVAPVSTVIRGAPSEVMIGVEEGLKKNSVINLDHVQTVEKRLLHRFVGSLDASKMAAVCRKLVIAAGCDL